VVVDGLKHRSRAEALDLQLAGDGRASHLDLAQQLLLDVEQPARATPNGVSRPSSCGCSACACWVYSGRLPTRLVTCATVVAIT
jgi:hypothetical protein